MTKQSKIKPVQIESNQCARCEKEIPKPLNGNSNLIRKPLPKERNAPFDSFNFRLEIWYERGFEGKRICRECLWL